MSSANSKPFENASAHSLTVTGRSTNLSIATAFSGKLVRICSRCSSDLNVKRETSLSTSKLKSIAPCCKMTPFCLVCALPPLSFLQRQVHTNSAYQNTPHFLVFLNHRSVAPFEVLKMLHQAQDYGTLRADPRYDAVGFRNRFRHICITFTDYYAVSKFMFMENASSPVGLLTKPSPFFFTSSKFISFSTL